ncbi:hypothetical protein CH352_00840 [Leptospira hartskeerlii]|uniref:Restriction endonuclease type IV Mrr domain-containing protein n=1 Tax=Leptospira hartskeerlii TaxID=2023177 RepID=A0A2M9X8C8_9LEPT|nr:restriction endonuclease [Leptospira hartskeerlii]PJZ23950.1 hypothetical protein CH357_18420 [Leptospira hartskeerlii]PJZ35214.1 hypothetical protein CH352_00840 [Leptospira hartskeerlii]
MNELKKPIIYQGRIIPINDLSPDDFENFLYGAFQILFSSRGWEVVGKSGGVGDGGFDFDAKNNNSEIICIQCKRYPETDLDLRKVAHELAKVALRSYLEKSNVVEHYIISSGKVKTEVDSARRSLDRRNVISIALRELSNQQNYINDKNAIVKAEPNKNLESIIENYILKLKTIHIWNGVQLDSEIGSIYSKLNDLLDKYFGVQNVLREYPRPDFNEKQYLESIQDTREYIDLVYAPENLPSSFYSRTRADNFHNNTQESTTIDNPIEISFREFFSNGRTIVLLLGEGGAGKTTSCKQLINYYVFLKKLYNTQEIPIYISFDRCGESIHSAITNELKILHGVWQSVPANFLLIFDGLNEVDSVTRKKLINEIIEIQKSFSDRIKICFASRKLSNIDTPVEIPIIKSGSIFKILKLDDSRIEKLIELNFSLSEKQVFLNELYNYKNVNIRFYLEQPFSLQLLISYFKEFQSIPDTIPQLLNRYFEERFERNREYLSLLKKNIENLPFSSVVKFNETLAYLWRIKYKRRYIIEPEAFEIITEALKFVKEKFLFGFSEVSEMDILLILLKNETLKEDNKYYYFQHDIIADYFAAKIFSDKWKETPFELKGYSKELIYFGSFYINKIFYLEKVISLSIELAARCALNMGKESEEYFSKYLLNNFNEEIEYSVITYFHAMSILATPELISFLKNIAFSFKKEIANNSFLVFQAQKYLCIIGDSDTLNYIINEVERDALFPGTISGGSTYLWQVGNRRKKIEISRLRLKNSEIMSLASISTLCFFGSETDIELVSSAIDKSEDRLTVLRGLYYLYFLSKNEFIKKIDYYLEETVNNYDLFLSLLMIRFQHGLPARTEALINLILSTNLQNDPHLLNKAKKTLFLTDLDSNQRKYLLDKLNQKEVNKSSLYQLLTHYKISEFSYKILKKEIQIENEYELYLILRHFVENDPPSEMREQYESLITENYENYKHNIDSICFPEFALLISRDNLINFDYVDFLKRLEIDIKNYNVLANESLDILKSENDIKEKYKQEKKIYNYIISLQYTCQVSDIYETLVTLFKIIELPHFNKLEQKESLRILFEKISDDKIDELIRNSMFGLPDKLFIFELIIQLRGMNEFRLNLLKNFLKSYLKIGRIDDLIDIVKHQWSHTLFNLIIDELRLFEKEFRNNFNEKFETMFFDKINNFIISRLSKEVIDNLIAEMFPIVIDADSNMKLQNIFIFWNGIAKDKTYF